MTTTLKAIETVYKGYRFRSRLEARWAVFLDSLGIKWVYEHEGFETSSGWYLPDFYLPEWYLWAEIKPGSPSDDHFVKPQAFVIEGKRHLMLISGNPWPDEYEITFMPPDIEQAGPWVGLEMMTCRHCNGFWVANESSMLKIGVHTCERHDSQPVRCPVIREAYQRARSARFEHGETP